MRDRKAFTNADYIHRQLGRVENGDGCRLKVTSSSGETHWLSVSAEQLEKIKKVLSE